MFDIQDFTGADGHPLRYGRLHNAGMETHERAMLFIPGLGGSVKGALNFLELLLPRFSMIYGPDVRGFGINPLETPLTHARDLLPDLEALFDQVILPAKHKELVLCGISLGGVLATLLASRYPERFSKVILLAPAFKPHPKTFSLGYTLVNTFAFLLQGRKAMAELPYGLEALTTNPDVLNDPEYANHPPLILNSGFLLGVRNLCRQAIAETRNLKLPTMVVIPGKDVVCDPKAMRLAYQRIPATTPKVCLDYPDLYHDVLFEMEHPEIAKALVDWHNQPAKKLAKSVK